MRQLKIRRIPNCKLCTWSEDWVCAAQGFRTCREVYNNQQCKKLYNVKNFIIEKNIK